MAFSVTVTVKGLHRNRGHERLTALPSECSGHPGLVIPVFSHHRQENSV